MYKFRLDLKESQYNEDTGKSWVTIDSEKREFDRYEARTKVECKYVEFETKSLEKGIARINMDEVDVLSISEIKHDR